VIVGAVCAAKLKPHPASMPAANTVHLRDSRFVIMQKLPCKRACGGQNRRSFKLDYVLILNWLIPKVNQIGGLFAFFVFRGYQSHPLFSLRSFLFRP
jgi:hypothetical protein